MKVISLKPKGQRMYKSVNFKHSKFGKIKRPFSVRPLDYCLWFDCERLEWVKDFNTYEGLTTTYYSMDSNNLTNPYSLKAVLRLINKWKYPKGTTFYASLPYVGHEFIIKT